MKAKTWLMLLALGFAGVTAAVHMGTTFTYQGQLKHLGAPADGAFDFQFELFDVAVSGIAISAPVLLEDVSVTDGMFTVELDFGTAPFAGDQLWLEIGVRDGASSGGFQGLAPRQKVTAVPYALHTEMVAMGAIGSVEISNNSITAADLASNSVRAAEIAAEAVGSSEVINNSLTAADLAANSVGLSEIITSEVQRRVTGLCPSGQFLRGVNQDGTVLCELVPKQQVITTLDDSANRVGEFTSIAIGSDDLPVISYYDDDNESLKVAHCTNLDCIGKNITTVDDPANRVGKYSSIAIGADGLPVISYHDGTAGTLKVAHCTNLDCIAKTITTVDDPANRVGLFTSIAIGADDLPVISYYDDDNESLKVAHCNDLACSGSDETITTVDDPANRVGKYSLIAIGADGLPVISYHDGTAGTLKVAHCTNLDCTAKTITTVDDPANHVGGFTSIAIGSDNFPMISYYDFTAHALKVAHCLNLTCTGKNIATVDDPANWVGRYTSIAIGSDNLPVISYYDQTARALKVARCNDPACWGGDETVTTVDDPANTVGWYTSIAIGSDNLPVISYYDQTAGTLKVVRCGTADCRL